MSTGGATSHHVCMVYIHIWYKTWQQELIVCWRATGTNESSSIEYTGALILLDVQVKRKSK